MNDVHSEHKRVFSKIRLAMQNFAADTVHEALTEIISPDADIHLCHPFGDVTGSVELYDVGDAPLATAFPDLERRDFILMAGEDHFGNMWVGSGGNYTGTFSQSWMDIPPTGHFAHMRFHEFFRFENSKIVEAQMVWDIPSLMMQADVWPMAPSLGREIMVPAPASQDGIIDAEYDTRKAETSVRIVTDMLAHLIKYPSQGGPEVMKMENFWHPRMNWYGPGGIGTSRGISGFRSWHQIPFIKALPDRGQYPDEINHHFFGDHGYVAVTGWPNMVQTFTGDGWLGLPPTGKKFSLRSLDFWRIEKNLIRENWVLVDLLDMYHQIGVDVFSRMRERSGLRGIAPIHGAA